MNSKYDNDLFHPCKYVRRSSICMYQEKNYIVFRIASVERKMVVTLCACVNIRSAKRIIRNARRITLKVNQILLLNRLLDLIFTEKKCNLKS